MRSFQSFVVHAVAVFAATMSTDALSQILSCSDTSTRPTWTRPQPDGMSVSTVTTRYGVVAFKVGTSGNFSILGETHGTFDLVAFLYNSSFNPATPLVGFLRGANASGFGGAENLTAVPLTSNTLYYAIGTGFNASDAGPLLFTFTGPSGATQLFPPVLPGDYNFNAKVDAADYVLWRKSLNSSVTSYTGADGNGSGLIDSGDYDIWRDNFSRTSGSGSSDPTVPEPTLDVLLLAAFLPLFFRSAIR